MDRQMRVGLIEHPSAFRALHSHTFACEDSDAEMVVTLGHALVLSLLGAYTHHRRMSIDTLAIHRRIFFIIEPHSTVQQSLETLLHGLETPPIPDHNRPIPQPRSPQPARFRARD